MVYNELEGDMLCAVCQKYGKPPVQARGAWVTRPINNWSKAGTWHLLKHRQWLNLQGYKGGGLMS